MRRRSYGNSAARIVYLERAYDLFSAELLPELPPREQVALTFGFPSRAAASASRKRIGECHYGGLAGSEETHLVTIHPCEWSEDTRVLAVLGHELCHVVAGPEAAHKAPFAKLARRIGLEGKPTATVPGPDFRAWVEATARPALPVFPEGALDLTARRRVQGTRQRLYHCGCEPPVKLRTARDDLDATCNLCGCLFELQTPRTKSRMVGEGGPTHV